MGITSYAWQELVIAQWPVLLCNVGPTVLVLCG